MSKFTKVISLALVQLWCISLYAQTTPNTAENIKPQVGKWAQEPQTFAGINLLKEIDTIPNCPYLQREYSGFEVNLDRWISITKEDDSLIACVEPPSDRVLPDLWGRSLGNYNIYLARNIDPLRRKWSITVENKKIVQLRSIFGTARFSDVEAVLVLRFGQPTKKEDVTLRTNGGASFPSVRHEWIGEKISIKIEKLTNRYYFDLLKRFIEEGEIVITNKEWESNKRVLIDNELKKKSNSL
jgi:hypothetical protein